MRKYNSLKVLAIAFALPVLFGSCKRDFICTCTYTTAIGGENTEKYTLEDQTRPDAIDNCENYEKNTNWLTSNCNL